MHFRHVWPDKVWLRRSNSSANDSQVPRPGSERSRRSGQRFESVSKSVVFPGVPRDYALAGEPSGLRVIRRWGRRCWPNRWKYALRSHFRRTQQIWTTFASDRCAFFAWFESRRFLKVRICFWLYFILEVYCFLKCYRSSSLMRFLFNCAVDFWMTIEGSVVRRWICLRREGRS